MIIPVYIFKQRDKKTLVLDQDMKTCVLVDLHVDINNLIGFWVESEKHYETQTVDITFYMGAMSFRTPYSKEIEDMFVTHLNRKHGGETYL